jgi:hypothetical protein
MRTRQRIKSSENYEDGMDVVITKEIREGERFSIGRVANFASQRQLETTVVQ